jgi:hypothetical protein
MILEFFFFFEEEEEEKINCKNCHMNKNSQEPYFGVVIYHISYERWLLINIFFGSSLGGRCRTAHIL